MPTMLRALAAFALALAGSRSSLGGMVLNLEPITPRSVEYGLPPVQATIALPYVGKTFKEENSDASSNSSFAQSWSMSYGVRQDLGDVSLVEAGEVEPIPCAFPSHSGAPCQNSLVRLLVESKGAAMLQLVFSTLVLCAGCDLMVYPLDPTKQPNNVLLYTNSTHNKAEPRPDQRAVVPLIPGDALVVELFLPATSDAVQSKAEKAAAADLVVVLSYAIHSFLDVFQNFLQSQKILQDSSTQPCENNVNCFPEFQQEKRAVALYSAGIRICTGSLINNALGDKQLFLTASHCVEADPVAGNSFVDPANLLDATFYFNGETFSCGTNNGPALGFIDTISGATLVDHEPFLTGVDYCVFRLIQTIPNSFNPYYLGWDSRDLFPPGVVTIHHPEGDFKKISFGAQPVIDGFLGTSNQLAVVWTSGTTAVASSGSPLLDNSTNRILGQLRGGGASCQSPLVEDYFGRVNLAFSLGLKEILVGASATGLLFMDGTEEPVVLSPPPPPPPSPPVDCPMTILGDVNGDGQLNIQDVVQILMFVESGTVEDPCDFLASDANSDGELNVVDVVIIQELTV